MKKKIAKVERTAKSGDVKAKKELAALIQFKEALLAGKNARAVMMDDEDRESD